MLLFVFDGVVVLVNVLVICIRVRCRYSDDVCMSCMWRLY